MNVKHKAVYLRKIRLNQFLCDCDKWKEDKLIYGTVCVTEKWKPASKSCERECDFQNPMNGTVWILRELISHATRVSLINAQRTASVINTSMLKLLNALCIVILCISAAFQPAAYIPCHCSLITGFPFISCSYRPLIIISCSYSLTRCKQANIIFKTKEYNVTKLLTVLHESLTRMLSRYGICIKMNLFSISLYTKQPKNNDKQKHCIIRRQNTTYILSLNTVLSLKLTVMHSFFYGQLPLIFYFSIHFSTLDKHYGKPKHVISI